MKMMMFLAAIGFFSSSYAVHYDHYEINQLRLNTELYDLATEYQRAYFTAQDPALVVDDIINADLIPLHKEAILHQLLSAVAAQPPQAAHQYLVDVMKTYPTAATMDHEEGRLPTAVFNLNSKAWGIENIWLSIRSEQQYSKLLSQDPDQAIHTFREVIASGNRPQWLAIRNSLAAADPKSRLRLVHQLVNEVPANQGLDPLISHLGLITGDADLIDKALSSTDRQVRETTLRSLPRYFPATQSRDWLMAQAQQGKDQSFSTSLLSTYAADAEVEAFLMQQLKQSEHGTSAAFALSQSKAPGLAGRLFNLHQQAEDQRTRGHVLMALRLHRSEPANAIIRQIEQSNQQATGGDS